MWGLECVINADVTYVRVIMAKNTAAEFTIKNYITIYDPVWKELKTYLSETFSHQKTAFVEWPIQNVDISLIYFLYNQKYNFSIKNNFHKIHINYNLMKNIFFLHTSFIVN